MNTLDLQGAAAYLHVSKDSMRDMADSGKVPGAKVGPTNGRQWIFTEESLDDYLREEIKRQTAERRKQLPGTVQPSAIQPPHRRKAAAPPSWS